MTSALSELQQTQTPTKDGTNEDEAKINYLKRAFKRLLDSKAPSGVFEINDNNKQLVTDLFYYAIRSPKSKYAPDKGLLFAGTIGTGKTTMLKAIGEFRNQLDKNGFKVWSCTTEIQAHFLKEGNNNKFTEAMDEKGDEYVDMGFDELGRECIPFNRYNNYFNVMADIIQARYTHYVNDKAQSHFTTNCTKEQLRELYGDFVADRLKEMCNWVQVVGESHRR